MAGWAAYHYLNNIVNVNAGNKTAAEEKREKKDEGKLHFSTLFLNCVSQLYLSNVFLKCICHVYFSTVYF